VCVRVCVWNRIFYPVLLLLLLLILQLYNVFNYFFIYFCNNFVILLFFTIILLYCYTLPCQLTVAVRQKECVCVCVCGTEYFWNRIFYPVLVVMVIVNFTMSLIVFLIFFCIFVVIVYTFCINLLFVECHEFIVLFLLIEIGGKCYYAKSSVQTYRSI